MANLHETAKHLKSIASDLEKARLEVEEIERDDVVDDDACERVILWLKRSRDHLDTLATDLTNMAGERSSSSNA